MHRVLVTGGRNYDKYFHVAQELQIWRTEYDEILVIQGGADGADRLARTWCDCNNVACLTVPADWANLGKAAGPRRNMVMFDVFNPDVVLAFPGGKGTEHMVQYAEQSGGFVVRCEPSELMLTDEV